MKFFFSLDEIIADSRPYVGGKAYNLAILKKQHIKIPKTLTLSSEVHDAFLDSTQLKYKIPQLLNRKDFNDMRWEEIWDLSIDIENLYLKTTLPESLKIAILRGINKYLGLSNLAIRSSSIFEDSPIHSFAGLHESYINITGEESILKYIKLVWASLWSNRALMYRKELNLEFKTAKMAVVLQHIINGDVSGIAFSKDPSGKDTTVVEAVYGLNQALVDGSIEPDRWIIDNKTQEIVKYEEAKRDKYLVASVSGVVLKKLPHQLLNLPPINMKQLKTIYEKLQKLERFYGRPHEIEWTFKNSILNILQCRPITTIHKNERGYEIDDQRPWYLSLVRSFEELKQVRDKVESEYFPEMNKISTELSQEQLSELTDTELSDEIEERWKIFMKWKDIYWHEFIPLAHGIRLFGKVYNEMITPENPTEFTLLLADTAMISTKRNQIMEKIATRIRKDKQLKSKILKKNWEDKDVLEIIDELKTHVIANSAILSVERDIENLIGMLLELAKSNNAKRGKRTDINKDKLEDKFINSFPENKRIFAKDLLGLGRDCYRLRDDDNIILGKIEKRYLESVNEGIDRLFNRGIHKAKLLERKDIVKSLRNRNYEPEISPNKKQKSEVFNVKARQIIGKAAVSGIARGIARVVNEKEDIFSFKQGEILVVDSIEPNMTFIVPLASAIVERRGGLLVHGAIIAREYKIPCVTGIPDATNLIKTGDLLTVDGYMGLVILQKNF